VRVLKGKRKIVKNLNRVKPENRLLRLLKSELGLQFSLTSVEDNAKKGTFKESQKEIDITLAEAEYQKTKAIIATQQTRSFC
jgi:hypothetical protein